MSTKGILTTSIKQHQCELSKGSNSCLPKLPPEAKQYHEWFRQFRKTTLVSSRDQETKIVFRSMASITAEKKRQIKQFPWYVIHPLSSFACWWETTLAFLWMFTFLNDPYRIAFHCEKGRHLFLLIDCIILSLSLLSFVIGYMNYETKEVILKPKLIVKNYLKSYFFFDVIGSIPFYSILKTYFLIRTPETSDEEYACIYYILPMMHMFRMARIKSMLQFLRVTINFFKVKDAYRTLFYLALLTVYFLHWWACIVYLVPKMQYECSTLPNNSWIVTASIEPHKGLDTFEVYLQCLVCAMCHFYRADSGMHAPGNNVEMFLFAACLTTGTIFYVYITVVVLMAVSSMSVSESKYEELVHQLDVYMTSKKLPFSLRNRLIMYYENKFQKHYFRETAILSTLSDHLVYEIFLYNCKSFIENVVIFKGLSKAAIGEIVGCLTLEMFLPNDVIMKFGTTAECIYFIAHGTVAVYTMNGHELGHMEDGDHFGALPFVLKNVAVKTQLCSYVAIEITEVYRLQKQDINNVILGQEDVLPKFTAVALERYKFIMSMTSHPDKLIHKTDILHELQSGKILEHTLGSRKK